MKLDKAHRVPELRNHPPFWVNGAETVPKIRILDIVFVSGFSI